MYDYQCVVKKTKMQAVPWALPSHWRKARARDRTVGSEPSKLLTDVLLNLPFTFGGGAAQ